MMSFPVLLSRISQRASRARPSAKTERVVIVSVAPLQYRNGKISAVIEGTDEDAQRGGVVPMDIHVLRDARAVEALCSAKENDRRNSGSGSHERSPTFAIE
jgi:hypothetical protein